MRPKYRGLATSDPRKGVHLTDKGRAEAERVIEAIGAPTFEGKAVETGPVEADPRRPTKDKERTYNPAHVLEDRRSRLLFREFKAERLADADVVHLLGLLGLYDHTPPAEVRREFRQLREAAVATEDTEFSSFLDAVSDHFKVYLNRPDPAHRREKQQHGA